MTRGAFAKAVIKGLKAPVTIHTRRALQAQMQAEGGNARNNPFNTTQTMPGATNYNSVGVKNYKTAEDGVAATVKTLHYKGHGYEAIVNALRGNAEATKIIAAIGDSDWGTESTLAAAVLDDIRKGRKPNTLAELEARTITS